MSKDQRLRVDLGERAYPIVIGGGLLGRLPQVEGIVDLVQGRRVFVATDQTVWELHGKALERGLATSGAQVIGSHAMQPGEPHKHLGSLAAYWDALLAAGVERGDLLVAFGGGVVGDVAGFAAATCLRGIDFLQVPTTLLAMVDSSVGGKTGIDHAKGKNLLGSFHQPVGVVADLSLLVSLPLREQRSGLAEIVKAALLGDAELFALLEEQGPALLANQTILADAICKAVAFKARVVAADEREAGARAQLNLGHTLGHAREVAAGYGTWTHGEAVAAGIAFASRLSERLGFLPSRDRDRIIQLLNRLGYRIQVSELGAEKMLAGMCADKKSRGGMPRWVLLDAIAGPRWGETVPEELVLDLLRESEECR